MHISLEAAQQNAVQAYGDNKIQINFIVYERSLIVSREKIITDVTINHIEELDESWIELLSQLNPEIIIIGHQNPGKFPPVSVISSFSQQRTGVECMSLAAASRTYNILLGEQRSVVGVFIL